ncbi:hypothetical protein RFM41_25670 [Mesorhizobium sp. VK25A]|uniref:Uncharacterized protein n=1 Tax=Mesorhizobium vachelliae TaxID=3072309 RepID=A0ABU5AA59_9HYPH|nr:MULTISPECIES: hypothetical protein [unclassified Mesorhizobium]MDX8534585.1 hypothetical protein [Mesorhizobium sp. VK25D]MDX8547162.1 hypothetical protein [Mesorhizobium sp. VK25A]
MNKPKSEPASTFYARLVARTGTNIDLEKITSEGHQIHTGPELPLEPIEAEPEKGPFAIRVETK